MKRFWLTLLVCLCAVSCACAADIALPLSGGSMTVRTSQLEDGEWLFLPAFADADALGLALDEADGDGVRRGTLPDGAAVSVMQSENLRALFLFSDDPVNEGRAYIDSAEHHETRTTGSLALIGTDGRVDHADHLRQLRGRGNGTWGGWGAKNPYQIKLETRADLLDTGLPHEKARTWVLLREFGDKKLLNRIAFDLGLELGLDESAHSEYVDLYYDGEYRGLYLLCEKTEIDPARIDETDYDELIEAWNRQAGKTDLETLPTAQGVNRFGNVYTYIEGVEDSGHVDAGAYQLEMESEFTLSDRCWFKLSNGSIIALKSPENASEAMMIYISERLQEAYNTLAAGGVNPETGRTIDEDFDVDAFARLILINELSANGDGFAYSSTWFVLPAGETRFRPGVPWDFDLAWTDACVQGLSHITGWMAQFYSCEAFREVSDAIYRNEFEPMILDVLLGEKEGEHLSSLDEYTGWIAASTRMDGRLWSTAQDLQAECSRLTALLRERCAWLRKEWLPVPGETLQVTLNCTALYGHTDSGLNWYVSPWSGMALDGYTFGKISDATGENYAVYGVEAFLKPGEGVDTSNLRITLNNQPIQAERQPDGRLRLLFTFEDPSYRPVDYYGEDIGMVYNQEVYLRRYPEVLDACGGDPDAVMDYFCDEGMYLGHQGNDFFFPPLILAHNPELGDYLGEDWQNYYWEFLSYGYEDGWLLARGTRYVIHPTDWLAQ